MIEILITDSKSPDYNHNREYFRNINIWAQDHCSSYTGYTVQDVSDCSLQWDEIASYTFKEEECATFFKLKWG